MAQVVFDRVSRHYRSGDQRLTVLDRAGLTIDEGSFCVLSGPSGSGKSTVLNLMGAIDRADAGRVLIDGRDPAALADGALADFRARTIGFVFQSFHLLPVLTALENVAWPLYFHGTPPRARMQAARAMLERVGLAAEAGRLPRRLSGGQQQRVAIARALVTRPRVVLADEPTAHLDRTTAREVMELLLALNRDTGTTLVAATHDPLVIGYARRHLRIAQGRVGEAEAGAGAEAEAAAETGAGTEAEEGMSARA